GDPTKPGEVRRRSAVVALGPQDSEHQGPVAAGGAGDPPEVLCEPDLEPKGRRRRIGQWPVEPDDRGRGPLELRGGRRRSFLAHGEVVLTCARALRANELALRNLRRAGRLC